MVRKKKEGIAISDYLTNNNINIVSSETLLLNNSQKVQLLNQVMALLVSPDDEKLKLELLNSISIIFDIEDKHSFFLSHLYLSVSELLDKLKALNIEVNYNKLLQMPIYEMAESLVRGFGLCKTNSDAYVQFYLDTVFDYSIKQSSDILGFLDYFETKKETLSIAMSNNLNAVSIMTIHKSKGLEFPVVVFPFADLNIYKELEPKEWFPLEKENFNDFSHTLLNYSKDFEYFGEEGLRIFNSHKSEQELDNINLLYVTLTRAIEQLYVISKKEVLTKDGVSEKKYSGLFINYLSYLGLWNDSDLSYSFGKPEKSAKQITKKLQLQEQEFISTAKEDHHIEIVTNSGYLWDSNQAEAIEKGNLIHNIMSKINTKEDVDVTITDFLESSTINLEQSIILKKIVFEIIEHPKLTNCFNSDLIIYNERDIITNQGQILRPDRVIINSKNEAILIDYKTGKENKSHTQQLISYQDILESMNLKVIKKILVYINNDIHVKEL